MIKRAAKKLVKVAQDYKDQGYLSPFASERRRNEADKQLQEYPASVSYDEAMHNGQKPALKRDRLSPVGYSHEYQPKNPEIGMGVVPWIATNTETKKTGIWPFRKQKSVSPLLALPNNYKRPFGPLMDRVTAEAMLQRRSRALDHFNPERYRRYFSDGYRPKLSDYMPGGDFEYAMKTYHPQLAYSLNKAKRLQDLPNNIDLGPEPQPEYWPLSTRHERSPRVQARKALERK